MQENKTDVRKIDLTKMKRLTINGLTSQKVFEETDVLVWREREKKMQNVKNI